MTPSEARRCWGNLLLSLGIRRRDCAAGPGRDSGQEASVPFLCGLLLASTPLLSSAMQVMTTSDGYLLTRQIVGPHVTLVGEPVLYGSPGSAGVFTGGGSVPLGFDSGIVLTTGRALLAAARSNADTAAGHINNAPGSRGLDALTSPYPTCDSTILEFTFLVTRRSSKELVMRFVFASEEHNTRSVSRYNDAFAFYLDGVNIGLLPDGLTGVSVNTVNDSLNSRYFRQNRFGDESAGSPGKPGKLKIEYDGMTTVLTARALDLEPGEHTVSLHIADCGDGFGDSAVFIEGVIIPPVPPPAPILPIVPPDKPPVPEPSTVITGALLLIPLAVQFARRCRKR